jgi:hypothetical protein
VGGVSDVAMTGEVSGALAGIDSGGAAGGALGGGASADAAGAGAGSGLAAALPWAAGALAVAAPFYGLMSPSYTLTGAYYDRLNQSFQDTVSKGTSDPNFMYNYATLMGSGELSSQQEQQLKAMYQQATAGSAAQRAQWVAQAGGLPTTSGVAYGGGSGGKSDTNRK